MSVVCLSLRLAILRFRPDPLTDSYSCFNEFSLFLGRVMYNKFFNIVHFHPLKVKMAALFL